MKNLKASLTLLITTLIVGGAQAGTVSISFTGLSSSPIFVTSTLQSLATGTELYIGTFKSVSDLNTRIATYKAGVTGNSTAEAQAAATALYSTTMNWLTSSSNFYSFPVNATTITQTGGTAGKVLFASSTSRTVNGVAAPYAGANASLSYTYANYAGGVGSQLWAFYGTGSEIAIVTDSTWTVPSSEIAGLTIGGAQLAATGAGVASELLLANYTDYAYAASAGVGSDLISSVAIAQTVIPEPSSASLLALGVAGLVALRVRRKS